MIVVSRLASETREHEGEWENVARARFAENMHCIVYKLQDFVAYNLGYADMTIDLTMDYKILKWA